MNISKKQLVPEQTAELSEDTPYKPKRKQKDVDNAFTKMNSAKLNLQRAMIVQAESEGAGADGVSKKITAQNPIDKYLDFKDKLDEEERQVRNHADT